MLVLIVPLAVAFGMFVLMIGVILGAGFVEGKRNPEEQGRP